MSLINLAARIHPPSWVDLVIVETARKRRRAQSPVRIFIEGAGVNVTQENG